MEWAANCFHLKIKVLETVIKSITIHVYIASAAKFSLKIETGRECAAAYIHLAKSLGLKSNGIIYRCFSGALK
jgi:hypothetical protein